MAEFYINTETITRQSSRLSEVSSVVKSVQGKVCEAKSGLAGIGLGKLIPAINALEARLAQHTGKTDLLASTLSNAMLKYIVAESNIMGIPFFLNPDFKTVAETAAENVLNVISDTDIPWVHLLHGSDVTFFSYEKEVESVLLPFWLKNTYTLNAMKIEGEYGDIAIGKGEFSFGGNYDSTGLSIEKFECHDEESQKNWVDEYRIEYNFDDQLHQDYKDNFSQRSTLHSFQEQVSENVSLLSAEGQLEGEYGSLSGEVGVLNAEAHALAYCGLFSDDGKFAPGLGAEVGASASLLEASGEARLGNDYYGAYVKGQAEFGKVAATASVDMGLYDEKGNFKPSLGAGAELEAIAAQVSGSVGNRVLGTDVGVTGSIGVGAGVHANVGLQDGKLSFDAGAYVGVGGSISLELDFNDTFDTISSAWDESSEWVGNTAGIVYDWAGDAADTVYDWAGDAADTVYDWAGDAWDTITFWD